MEVLEIGNDFMKLKLLRNGFPEFEKIYPKDLFNIDWMIPSINSKEFEIFNF